ncbi:MAG: TetR/AcrR family transcriptional regulator [Oscillatoriophycideae cyanobacterium NC_groundwater_1537_Pr4_S-0.65um_50_18]|nr:TetR/AcrR family transcriptional regulator [Oscillatoriophycideae cyanobacterium NC_groundwater_1537_Pr4_S-0.65um_50_18]
MELDRSQISQKLNPVSQKLDPVSQKLDLGGDAGSAKSPNCRRRCPKAHQAILSAAADLLAEKGYGGVSIEAIAQRAGVGKQTIYRWWPCKAEVMMEVCAAQMREAASVPDTGCVKTDLLHLLHQLTALITQTNLGRVVTGLIAEAQTDAKVAEAFQAQFVTPQRATTRSILLSGIARGELCPDLELEVAIDTLQGAVWYRLGLTHAPLDENFAAALVNQLLIGMEHLRES